MKFHTKNFDMLKDYYLLLQCFLHVPSILLWHKSVLIKPKKGYRNKEEEKQYLLSKKRESMPPGLADAVMNRSDGTIRVRGNESWIERYYSL